MSRTPGVTLPEWLVAGRSETYLRNSFSLLFNRERQREYARLTSLSNNSRSVSRTQLLRAFSPENAHEPAKYYSVSIGGSPENQLGNRYSNIKPYDRTRVVVGNQGGCTSGSSEGKVNGRYFNGSWVRELYGKKLWIATQAPLPETAHAFLSVIAQPIMASPPSSFVDIPSGSRVRTIVQLTLNQEGGRTKAHLYFPSEVGATMIVEPEPGYCAPPFKVTLLEQRFIDEARCLKSKVAFVPAIRNPGGPVVFTHLLYTAWPDHGVPAREDQASLLNFVCLVDRVNKEPIQGSSSYDLDPPSMVNCSAGIGRTGTFIALSSLLRTFGSLSPSTYPSSPPGRTTAINAPYSPLGPLPREFQTDPVLQEIDSLREQRPWMVEKIEQAGLIYSILELVFSQQR
ncbi:protein-tyrosine phosphatase-like protein [Pisolithus marmoratus]|nr:protein-tyrosine phosphatase-like protein [Pisolithus marmoratus]